MKVQSAEIRLTIDYSSLNSTEREFCSDERGIMDEK